MKKFTRIPFLISVFIAVLVLAACGPLPAGAEVDINPDGQSAEVEFIGTVESIAPDQWIVSGQFVKLNAQTVIADNPLVGENVQVRAMVDANGEVTALRIQSQSQVQVQSVNGQSAFEFTGIVESIAANIWTVSGTTFSLTSQTEVKGNILVGDTVKVAYVTNSDGSFSALEIHPTEALAAGNNFQFQNQNGQEFELFGTVEAIAADTWTVSGQTFALNAQTEINGAVVVGDFVKVHLYDDNGTYTAREIALAGAESQALGAHLEFSGVVDAIAAGSITVNGLTFTITNATEIKGAIASGDTVKVEASIAEDGTLTALEVTKMDGSTIGGSNGGGGSSSSIGVSSSQGSSFSSDDHGGSSSFKSEDDDHGSSSSSSSESSDDNSSSTEDEDHGDSSSGGG